MPPRIRLSRAESAQLGPLLALVDQRRPQFPADADGPAQATWIARTYAADANSLSNNLITLLLFEHGVHRSAEQVAHDLRIHAERSDSGLCT